MVRDHLGFVAQLVDQLVDVRHLPAALALGGSTTLSVFRRGATSTPSASGFSRLERLLLRLHDVRQRRVARLVQAQVGRDDRGQLHLDRLQAAVDLARHLRASRRRSRPSRRTSPAASRAAPRASGRSGWRRRRSPACRGSRAAAASFSTTAFSSFATASGCSSTSVSTRIARSAPMASAVRSVSWHAATPARDRDTSVATPASLSRTASSTAISSNGFIDILTFAVRRRSRRLDAHLDVEVDDALDGHEDFHRGSTAPYTVRAEL